MSVSESISSGVFSSPSSSNNCLSKKEKKRKKKNKEQTDKQQCLRLISLGYVSEKSLLHSRARHRHHAPQDSCVCEGATGE